MKRPNIYFVMRANSSLFCLKIAHATDARSYWVTTVKRNASMTSWGLMIDALPSAEA